MPPEISPVSNLPASFLEAVTEYCRSPVTFLSKTGRIVALPFVGGGAPDDDDNDKPGDGGDGNGTGADGGDGTGTGNDADADDDDDDDDGDDGLPDSVKAILRKNRKEARDARKAAAAAAKAVEDANAKVRKYEDRDKSDLDKFKERAEQAEARAAELEKANKTIALRAAFLADTSVAWVDPEDALELAFRKYGLQDLDVDDATGTVADRKALRKVIKDLSSEKAYLVKSADSDGDSKRPSGAKFNGGGKQKSGDDTEALARKYPAMQGRRRVP